MKELNHTQVTTKPFVPSGRSPVGIFVDKDRRAFFWFCIAILAVLTALIQPHWLIGKLKQRERVVIIDPAGTYYVSPLLDFEEAKDLHAQQSTLAALAFLERSPNGADHPDLLKQMFLSDAFIKAQKQISTELDEFKSKQLHQKPEIAKIDILETRDLLVMTQLTGQLVRTGVFEGRSFSEAVPFRLAFKMQRNPDMTKNGRFPTAIKDFKYETTPQN